MTRSLSLWFFRKSANNPLPYNTFIFISLYRYAQPFFYNFFCKKKKKSFFFCYRKNSSNVLNQYNLLIERRKCVFSSAFFVSRGWKFFLNTSGRGLSSYFGKLKLSFDWIFFSRYEKKKKRERQSHLSCDARADKQQ